MQTKFDLIAVCPVLWFVSVRGWCLSTSRCTCDKEMKYLVVSTSTKLLAFLFSLSLSCFSKSVSSLFGSRTSSLGGLPRTTGCSGFFVPPSTYKYNTVSITDTNMLYTQTNNPDKQWQLNSISKSKIFKTWSTTIKIFTPNETEIVSDYILCTCRSK